MKFRNLHPFPLFLISISAAVVGCTNSPGQASWEDCGSAILAEMPKLDPVGPELGALEKGVVPGCEEPQKNLLLHIYSQGYLAGHFDGESAEKNLRDLQWRKALSATCVNEDAAFHFVDGVGFPASYGTLAALFKAACESALRFLFERFDWTLISPPRDGARNPSLSGRCVTAMEQGQYCYR